jgi:hypothetical protein
MKHLLCCIVLLAGFSAPAPLEKEKYQGGRPCPRQYNPRLMD